MLRPTDDEPGKAGDNGRMSPSWRGSVQARLTDEQWLELIASDSPLHQRWEKYLDTAALYENNGGFFWWGGRPGPYGTQQLFREGPAPGGEFYNFFRGQKYGDVVSCDNYREREVGTPPSAEVLKGQPFEVSLQQPFLHQPRRSSPVKPHRASDGSHGS